MRNDSSTACLSHWLTTQRPSRCSATRSLPASSPARHSSTASRSSASARVGRELRAAFPGALDDVLQCAQDAFLGMISCANRARPSRSALPSRSELASSSGWRVGVRHEEYVLGALADGQDLGVLQRDALLVEDLGDLEQQAGPVAGDELDDRARVLAVARDRDLHRRREHPHLARRAARDLERLVAAVPSGP